MKLSLRQAVILAGGQGKRLHPLTLDTPKPMLLIHNKPFLEYLLEIVKENGISEVIFLVGFQHEKIRKHFGNGKKFGLKIKYSYCPVDVDTGTRIRKAYKLLHKYFLLLYGDNVWPLHLSELVKNYQKKNKKAQVVVYSNFDNSRKNNMHIGENGLVTLYDRKRKSTKANGVDMGFYILDRKVIMDLPATDCSFEETALLHLIAEKQLVGFMTHHKYYSLTNIDRLKETELYLAKKKIVFLDRDGVINRKPDKATYITSWPQFSFLPKVKNALKKLNDYGFDLYILTNQPGIARGMMTSDDLDGIHSNMLDKLKKSKVLIRKIYSCTHGWDDKCFCRKPNPGLFFLAAANHHINLFQSFTVGDDERDIIAGKLAGCKTVFLNNTNKGNADIITTSLPSAVEKIIAWNKL